MNELRWILLAAGVLLIAGIYAWGVRARRRAAAPEHERMVRVEPARTVSVVAEPEPEEPEAPVVEPVITEPAAPEDDPFGEFEADQPPRRAAGTGRREPRIEPQLDPRFESAAPQSRLEPTLESEVAPAVAPAADERPAPAVEPSRKPPSQKIIAVRVVAAAGAQIAGERLLEALHADGFTFGRYQIFHRLDDTGRPLVSLASLKEPGTFDPATMPGAQFRGIALFAVMPGPLPGVRAFDELIVTARALAATLGGQLQDERGAPLSLQRIGQLREEAAEFERARGAVPGA
jgi:cell division protein ZipA